MGSTIPAGSSVLIAPGDGLVGFEPSWGARTTMDRPAILVVILFVCWAIGSTIVGRSFTALEPGPFDAQLFAYVGLQWIHGHIPYSEHLGSQTSGYFCRERAGFLPLSQEFYRAGVDGRHLHPRLHRDYLLVDTPVGGAVAGRGTDDRFGGDRIQLALLQPTWKPHRDISAGAGHVEHVLFQQGKPHLSGEMGLPRGLFFRYGLAL